MLSSTNQSESRSCNKSLKVNVGVGENVKRRRNHKLKRINFGDENNQMCEEEEVTQSVPSDDDEVSIVEIMMAESDVEHSIVEIMSTDSDIGSEINDESDEKPKKSVVCKVRVRIRAVEKKKNMQKSSRRALEKRLFPTDDCEDNDEEEFLMEKKSMLLHKVQGLRQSSDEEKGITQKTETPQKMETPLGCYRCLRGPKSKLAHAIACPKSEIYKLAELRRLPEAQKVTQIGRLKKCVSPSRKKMRRKNRTNRKVGQLDTSKSKLSVQCGACRNGVGSHAIACHKSTVFKMARSLKKNNNGANFCKNTSPTQASQQQSLSLHSPNGSLTQTSQAATIFGPNSKIPKSLVSSSSMYIYLPAPECPPGWTKSVFNRSGNSKYYFYYFSPKTKKRFRSLKAVHNFDKYMKSKQVGEDEAINMLGNRISQGIIRPISRCKEDEKPNCSSHFPRDSENDSLDPNNESIRVQKKSESSKTTVNSKPTTLSEQITVLPTPVVSSLFNIQLPPISCELKRKLTNLYSVRDDSEIQAEAVVQSFISKNQSILDKNNPRQKVSATKNSSGTWSNQKKNSAFKTYGNIEGIKESHSNTLCNPHAVIVESEKYILLKPRKRMKFLSGEEGQNATLDSSGTLPQSCATSYRNDAIILENTTNGTSKYAQNDCNKTSPRLPALSMTDFSLFDGSESNCSSLDRENKAHVVSVCAIESSVVSIKNDDDFGKFISIVDVDGSFSTSSADIDDGNTPAKDSLLSVGITNGTNSVKNSPSSVDIDNEITRIKYSPSSLDIDNGTTSFKELPKDEYDIHNMLASSFMPSQVKSPRDKQNEKIEIEAKTVELRFIKHNKLQKYDTHTMHSSDKIHRSSDESIADRRERVSLFSTECNLYGKSIEEHDVNTHLSGSNTYKADDVDDAKNSPTAGPLSALKSNLKKNSHKSAYGRKKKTLAKNLKEVSLTEHGNAVSADVSSTCSSGEDATDEDYVYDDGADDHDTSTNEKKSSATSNENCLSLPVRKLKTEQRVIQSPGSSNQHDLLVGKVMDSNTCRLSSNNTLNQAPAPSSPPESPNPGIVENGDNPSRGENVGGRSRRRHGQKQREKHRKVLDLDGYNSRQMKLALKESIRTFKIETTSNSKQSCESIEPNKQTNYQTYIQCGTESENENNDGNEMTDDVKVSADTPRYQEPSDLFTTDEFKSLWRECEYKMGVSTEQIEKRNFVRGASHDGKKNLSLSQTRAQYGRLLFDGMEKVIKITGLKRNEIFVDIGHGIGNAIFQAAFTVGSESRGLEVVPERCRVADQFYSALMERVGVVERVGIVPSDGSEHSCLTKSIGKITLKEASLTDPKVRSFMNEADVALVNNSNDIFGTRSGDVEGKPMLDAYVAGTFGMMKPGSRMVTLHPIFLGRSLPEENERRKKFGMNACADASFFTYKRHTLGRDVVSWTRKEIIVHCYTRVQQSSNDGTALFLCGNKTCGWRGCATAAVNDDGLLIEECVYCETKRGVKTRKD